MIIELDNYTMSQVAMVKFAQSCERFSDDRHAIMEDCGICQASYYRYRKILNMINSNDCHNYDIADDETADTIPV